MHVPGGGGSPSMPAAMHQHQAHQVPQIPPPTPPPQPVQLVQQQQHHQHQQGACAAVAGGGSGAGAAAGTNHKPVTFWIALDPSASSDGSPEKGGPPTPQPIFAEDATILRPRGRLGAAPPTSYADAGAAAVDADADTSSGSAHDAAGGASAVGLRMQSSREQLLQPPPMTSLQQQHRQRHYQQQPLLPSRSGRGSRGGSPALGVTQVVGGGNNAGGNNALSMKYGDFKHPVPLKHQHAPPTKSQQHDEVLPGQPRVKPSPPRSAVRPQNPPTAWELSLRDRKAPGAGAGAATASASASAAASGGGGASASTSVNASGTGASAIEVSGDGGGGDVGFVQVPENNPRGRNWRNEWTDLSTSPFRA